MDESYAIRRYEQAAALLPLRWQQQARQLPPRQMARAEELRLRAGGPMTVLLPEGEITPGQGGQSPTVTQTDLEQLCDAVTDYSRYAAGETLSRGYLTARGGFRVGVCGTAVLREGVNTNLRDISSVTVRIGREQPGLGDEVLSQLFREGQFCSTVLLSPPGLGKTTLLRDLIRGLSDGTPTCWTPAPRRWGSPFCCGRPIPRSSPWTRSPSGRTSPPWRRRPTAGCGFWPPSTPTAARSWGASLCFPSC